MVFIPLYIFKLVFILIYYLAGRYPRHHFTKAITSLSNQLLFVICSLKYLNSRETRITERTIQITTCIRKFNPMTRSSKPTTIAAIPKPSVMKVPVAISKMMKSIPSTIQCHHVMVCVKNSTTESP